MVKRVVACLIDGRTSKRVQDSVGHERDMWSNRSADTSSWHNDVNRSDANLRPTVDSVAFRRRSFSFFKRFEGLLHRNEGSSRHNCAGWFGGRYLVLAFDGCQEVSIRLCAADHGAPFAISNCNHCEAITESEVLRSKPVCCFTTSMM